MQEKIYIYKSIYIVTNSPLFSLSLSLSFSQTQRLLHISKENYVSSIMLNSASQISIRFDAMSLFLLAFSFSRGEEGYIFFSKAREETRQWQTYLSTAWCSKTPTFADRVRRKAIHQIKALANLPARVCIRVRDQKRKFKTVVIIITTNFVNDDDDNDNDNEEEEEEEEEEEKGQGLGLNTKIRPPIQLSESQQ